MMFKAIILGIVQGLTEFLPISSSGHLAIVERIFNITEPVTFAVFLHLGTFLATIAYFFKPLSRLTCGIIKGDRQSLHYFYNIIIGSIPIAAVGLLFRSYVEKAFHDARLIALLLGMTGIILVVTAVIKKGKGKPKPLSALLIGIGQMFALLPGISRSGMTIAAGLYMKIEPEESFTFSFLLSLPAILGANILELRSLTTIDNILSIIIGICFSFVAGIIALKVLHTMVRKHFHLFGVYCLIISILLLLLT